MNYQVLKLYWSIRHCMDIYVDRCMFRVEVIHLEDVSAWWMEELNAISSATTAIKSEEFIFAQFCAFEKNSAAKPRNGIPI